MKPILAEALEDKRRAEIRLIAMPGTHPGATKTNISARALTNELAISLPIRHEPTGLGPNHH